LALVLACGPEACGQAQAAPAARTLSLAQARQLALQRNGDFRSAQFQVDAALGQLKAARELPNPTLGLSTAKVSTDGVPEATALGNGFLSRAYDSIVSLSELIQVSKRGLLRDSANAGVHVAEFQLDDARRLLLQGVTQAYVAALLAQQQARVLSTSAQALRHEADVAAHRYTAGDLSKADQSRIEIAAEQDELSAASQGSAAAAAIVALESLVGEPNSDGSTVLSDSLEGLVSMPADLGGATVLRRPDIAAAEAAVDQAELNVRLARHQRIPDVTVSVQYERNPPAQPDTVGVGLSLPLPVLNQYSGEILGALAARNQAQAHLDKVRVQATADVASARLAYTEAATRSARYQGSLLPQSADVTRSVAYAYEKGGAALIDLLDAQRSDNDIRLAAVQAQADTAAALAGLLAALGRL
jgi:cobalt-zinc-cadmium efflux system outer membrane protein